MWFYSSNWRYIEKTCDVLPPEKQFSSILFCTPMCVEHLPLHRTFQTYFTSCSIKFIVLTQDVNTSVSIILYMTFV